MSTETIDEAQKITGRAPRSDRSFRALVVGSGLVVLVVLGLIAITMIGRTTPAFRHMGLRFFTERRWAPPKAIYGALALIWGTLFTSVVAFGVAVMAIFIGMAVLMPVLLIGHMLRGRRADDATAPAGGESGGV